MDSTAVIIVVILALVAIGALFVFRRQLRLNLRGPLGTGVDFDGSNAEANKDTFAADNGQIGNVNVDGAAPTTETRATNRGKIGDVTIKRPRR